LSISVRLTPALPVTCSGCCFIHLLSTSSIQQIASVQKRGRVTYTNASDWHSSGTSWRSTGVFEFAIARPNPVIVITTRRLNELGPQDAWWQKLLMQHNGQLYTATVQDDEARVSEMLTKQFGTDRPRGLGDSLPWIDMATDHGFKYPVMEKYGDPLHWSVARTQLAKQGDVIDWS